MIWHNLGLKTANYFSRTTEWNIGGPLLFQLTGIQGVYQLLNHVGLSTCQFFEFRFGTGSLVRVQFLCHDIDCWAVSNYIYGIGSLNSRVSNIFRTIFDISRKILVLRLTNMIPMVESNPQPAVRTNIFGSLATLEAAIENSVENFLLISTDQPMSWARQNVLPRW